MNDTRQPAEVEISAIGIANALLRRRRLLIVLPLLAAMMFVGITILRGPRYNAESLFMLKTSPAASSNLAGLAAQFGVTLTGGASGETPELYARLLASRELLESLVLTEYTVPAPAGGADSLRGNLIQLLDIEGETQQRRLRTAMREVRDNTEVSTEKTGLIRVATTSRWPDLAVQINRRMLDLLNSFHLDRRKSQASAERQFVEGRLAQSQRELAAAEATLKRFFERNRSYQSSPELAFEAARLQRMVDLRQNVHLSLAGYYEQARIDEVREMPVITIVDRPEGSVVRKSGVLTGLLLALIVGLFFAIFLIIVLEFLQRQVAKYPREYEEFRTLRASLGTAGGLSALMRRAWARRSVTRQA